MPIFSNTTSISVDVFPFYIYAIEGGILVVFNVFFVTMIMLIKRLRCQKEYILIAGNMFFDILFGMTYLLAGIYRVEVWWGSECKKNKK